MIPMLLALLAVEAPAPPPDRVNVALAVTVDGRPLEKAWRAFVDDLFAWLDRDGDGHLQAREVAGWSLPKATGEAVPFQFGQIDGDADGKANRVEFWSFVDGRLGSPVQVRYPETPADLRRANAELARRLDRDGDGVLSLAERREARKLLAALDDDEDGSLTPAEIVAGSLKGAAAEAAPAAAPLAELKLELVGRRPGERRTIGGQCWTIRQTGTAEDRLAASRRFLLAQFQAAANDRPGVTLQEAQDAEAFLVASVFAQADRDGDGRLTSVELTAYLDLLQRGLNCFAVIDVSDAGRGLFDLYDADADGRLSARELAAEPPLLAGKAWRLADLPRSVRLASSPGPAGKTLARVPLGDIKEPPGAKAAVPPAPAWFRAMDRNGDGVVTAEEFTGPRDAWRRLDRDGNGLLTIEEADPKQAEETQEPLSPSEARRQVGKAVTVEMVVKAAKDRLDKRGEIYLDSDEDLPVRKPPQNTRARNLSERVLANQLQPCSLRRKAKCRQEPPKAISSHTRTPSVTLRRKGRKLSLSPDVATSIS